MIVNGIQRNSINSSNKNKTSPAFTAFLVKSQKYTSLGAIVDDPSFNYLVGKKATFIDAMKILDAKPREMGQALYNLMNFSGFKRGVSTTIKKNAKGISVDSDLSTLVEIGKMPPRFLQDVKKKGKSGNKITNELYFPDTKQRLEQQIVFVPDEELPKKFFIESLFNTHWARS